MPHRRHDREQDVIRLLAAALGFVAATCSAQVVVTPPPGEAKAVRDADMLAQVRRLGRDGDWLVIRGYHLTDHMVSLATSTPWSHAAVLDMERDQVIEAEAIGVHTTPLAGFVAKSHRLLLMRPNWSGGKASAEALLKARGFVGKRYDFLGLIGVDVPERFYCSELAVAVYQPHIPAGILIPRPVAPAQLHFWGRILYDSGDP